MDLGQSLLQPPCVLLELDQLVLDVIEPLQFLHVVLHVNFHLLQLFLHSEVILLQLPYCNLLLAEQLFLLLA
jgi:hypothetical protein